MIIFKIVGFRPQNHHWVRCNRHDQSSKRPDRIPRCSCRAARANTGCHLQVGNSQGRDVL
ncbi:uncharacterized protein Bfra_005546 [Botrytis fragariae]|uniref:Uncharacterized protein n=1 Tax=Botrytis fragariae TaxID=1964551 RepID=A0A8H6EH90_9HELO|nr:uncharacterized protein Bfra_005546 [Botrytis fragariae]KAF5872192.1 hypothetical protein Bfra_005546 [Botrytis fragariae]